ncbi:MAG: methyltransferase domain-containing protein, partial [Cyanobacteria bacterium P01_F01_bin.42]
MTSSNDNAMDLTTSVLTNLSIRTLYRGDIIFPCIPAALGAYVGHIDKLMRNLGKGFSPEEQQQVHTLLQTSMHQGFTQSPNAQIVFHYEVKGTADLQKTLACEVSLILPSLGEQYDTWYQMEETHSLFGSAPDAKAMDVLKTLWQDNLQAETVVLDVGAGDGRNAIPIAQTGIQVHAVDLTPELTGDLRRRIKSLPIQVFEADFLDQETTLQASHYDLVLLSEVASHFRSAQDLRCMFIKATDCLKPGKYLLLNCFIAQNGFEPDEMALEMSQIAWSSLFT